MAVEIRNPKSEIRNKFGNYFVLRASCFVLPARRGFALLVAVIFMSVMLAIGLALSSLGYKQQILASASIESQYAFYTADAALECALYADQQLNAFDYAGHSAINPPNALVCDTAVATPLGYSYDTTRLYVAERISLDEGKRCADVTIYKYATQQANNVTTYIFSQGYDVSCEVIGNPEGARFVSRGLNIVY